MIYTKPEFSDEWKAWGWDQGTWREKVFEGLVDVCEPLKGSKQHEQNA
jgi:hypothetical protein